jgi:hypothetical protein
MPQFETFASVGPTPVVTQKPPFGVRPEWAERAKTLLQRDFYVAEFAEIEPACRNFTKSKKSREPVDSPLHVRLFRRRSTTTMRYIVSANPAIT